MALFEVGIVVIILVLIFYYGTSTYDYWKNRHVPFIQPVPFFGSLFPTLFGLMSVPQWNVEMYSKFPDEPYVGMYIFRKPMLLLRDPDVINTILIKDFNTFYNRGINSDEKLDELSQHLVNLRDGKWKNLRTKLTPVFSSGKLKTMHQSLVVCAESLVEEVSSFAVGGLSIEARDVMSGFTMDVIGHCAFGLQMNALKDPESEFRQVGRTFFNPSLKTRLRNNINFVWPQLLSLLRWKVLPEKTVNFFVNAIREAMDFRENSQVEVKDFLQLLINIKKEEAEKNLEDHSSEVLMNDQVMTSNALVFFLAGYETTGATLSYCLFELAQNEEIQDKLREEIDLVLKKYQGIPSFEAIKEMTYLDQVISETLRKYPPIPVLRREATQNYKFPDRELVLEKGSRVLIPTFAIQHDSKYYPDPEKFDPDRFLQESLIKKGTYLPFGDGPRICIGLRFAKLEMEIALAKLISKFKFSRNEQTPKAVKFNPRSDFLIPETGLWLQVTKR